jgi:hypothetical protein
MKKNATHILRSYDGTRQGPGGLDQKYKAEDLYRADGLLVAARQDDVVRFGDDISTAQNRLFIDEETASRFLRRLADVDLICAAEHMPLKDRIYIYADEERCPRLAVIDNQQGGEKEIERADGSRVILARPGNMHSIKLH